MRIIGGKYGKRRFSLPSGFNGRPTTDIAKEGLFNILDNRINWEETRVLDLFAGSGSIGIEALSRGAKSVVAIEKNPRHASFIKSVAKQLNDEKHSTQVRDVFQFLRNSADVGTFQLIFADPPYALPQLPLLPMAVLGSTLLGPNGLFILEHPKEFDFRETEGFVELRRYGTVHFSFFRSVLQQL